MSLKRSPMPPSKVALKGSGYLRCRVKEVKAATKVKTGMKSSRPRMTPIRKAARGQDCTLQILGVCNGDPETTVLCHSNQLSDGKGMGLKAPDTAACFGCSSCHDVLDGRAPRPDGMTLEGLLRYFVYARTRTHEILRAKGLMPKEAA